MNDPETHSSPGHETGPGANQADTLACIAACTALSVGFADVLLALPHLLSCLQLSHLVALTERHVLLDSMGRDSLSRFV